MITPASFHHYPQHVAALTTAALEAVAPGKAVQRFMQRVGNALSVGPHTFDLLQGKVYLVSVGKAAVPMANAAAEILGDELFRGLAISKHFSGIPAPTLAHPAIISLTAAHPVADQRSISAAVSALNLLSATTDMDLVFFLISGGASALIAQPALPLAEWQILNEALLASGCTIREFNAVRRQLDRVKGGGLAAAAAPARCLSLILSDVIGNDLAAIGSGPTYFSAETPRSTLQVFQTYHLEEILAPKIWGKVMAAITAGSEITARPTFNAHFIVGDVRRAAEAAAHEAIRSGFAMQILTTHLEGEAREVGKFVAACARDCPPGHGIILGGETTVTLRGTGIGGRNTEIALAAAIALEGAPQRIIATLATDGDDGPTGAAGAMVSGDTIALGHKQGSDAISFLANNDSWSYFEKLDKALPTLIKTGPTGTNVNDLIFILHYTEEV